VIFPPSIVQRALSAASGPDQGRAAVRLCAAGQATIRTTRERPARRDRQHFVTIDFPTSLDCIWPVTSSVAHKSARPVIVSPRQTV
jgi:hypothetical protein